MILVICPHTGDTCVSGTFERGEKKRGNRMLEKGTKTNKQTNKYIKAHT